jgi:hypothetical protein
MLEIGQQEVDYLPLPLNVPRISDFPTLWTRTPDRFLPAYGFMGNGGLLSTYWPTMST